MFTAAGLGAAARVTLASFRFLQRLVHLNHLTVERLRWGSREHLF